MLHLNPPHHHFTMSLPLDLDMKTQESPTDDLLIIEPPADPLITTPAWDTFETSSAPSWDFQTPQETLPEPRVLYPTVSKQRPKQYKRPTPSKFCHVCGRKTANVPVAICRRITEGMCRKVVCRCCFEKYGWDLHDMTSGDWVCTHCRDTCVARAQCNIYGRTNYKRHLRLRRRRVGRELLKIGKPDHDR